MKFDATFNWNYQAYDTVTVQIEAETPNLARAIAHRKLVDGSLDVADWQDGCIYGGEVVLANIQPA